MDSITHEEVAAERMQGKANGMTSICEGAPCGVHEGCGRGGIRLLALLAVLPPVLQPRPCLHACSVLTPLNLKFAQE